MPRDARIVPLHQAPQPAPDLLTSALADAINVKASYDEMKRNYAPAAAPDPTGPDYAPSDAVRALRTKPLRIDIDFADPLKTRRELEILGRAVIAALAYSRDHERGPYNQLADMRHVLRMAGIEIQHLRGRTTAGRQG